MELAAVHDRRTFSPDIPIPECTQNLSKRVGSEYEIASNYATLDTKHPVSETCLYAVSLTLRHTL